MKEYIWIFIVIALVALIIFGFPYLIYWLVLKAGAPRYVAVICGLAVFCFGGWFANKQK